MYFLILGIAAGLLLILLWLIKPGRRRVARWGSLLSSHYAHRGLYTKDQKIPENSLTAFKRAVMKGYGIELDVQMSKDGTLFVFHDDSLKRMTGFDGDIRETSDFVLRKLCLLETEERIPTFDEVLRLVDGKAPIIIELKNHPEVAVVSQKVYKRLLDYDGPYCMESFNPFMVSWFKKHAPAVVRGQLATGFRGYTGIPCIQCLILSNLVTNFIGKPDFIAYDHHCRNNLFFRLVKKLFHPLTVAWTVRDTDNVKEILKDYDLMIFEYFEP